MNEDFFTYLERLELLVFYAGYPLLYAIVFVLSGRQEKSRPLYEKARKLLPLSYGITGLLYAGMQGKKLYTAYILHTSFSESGQPYLQIWALLALLFLFPLFRRKPVYSLLHSLVFFSIIVKDLLIHLFQSTGNTESIKNEMNTHTVSFFLQSGVLLIVLVAHRLIRKKNTSPR